MAPKKPIQSSDDRDAAGLKRMSEKRMTPPTGVPSHEIFPDEELTKPTDIVSRSGTRWDKDKHFREEMTSAVDRYENDPAYRALWNIFRRERKESGQTSAVVPLDKELLERIDRAEESIHRMDTIMKSAKWLLGFCIAAVLGAIVTVAFKIYDGGYQKGQLVDRVEQLEKKLDKLGGKIP